MQEVIGAESWVLDILRFGVKLDFAAPPPESYTEPNNKSAQRDIEFLMEKVSEWENPKFQMISLKIVI